MSDRADPSPPTAPEAGAWPAHPDLSLALNHMGSFDWDLDAGRMHLDYAGLQVFDLQQEEYDGRPESLGVRVPWDEAIRLDSLVARAIKDGSQTYGMYFRIRRRDGTLRWTHTQGHIQRDAGGKPHRVIGIVRDATLELGYSAQQLALDEERRRQTSIVEQTTAALAHARTVQDVIGVLRGGQGLTRLGAVNLVMGLVEGGRIRLVAEGHIGTYVQEASPSRLDDEEFPMTEVVRTMQPRFVHSRQEFATRYPKLWPVIERLSIDAGAYLPLIAQGRPIGALGLFYEGKSTFSPEERNLLIALGSSIAQSLQRAMLFDREHDLAESLQQAMLPRNIPRIPQADIAVRYRAAGDGQDIGGDWYDVIPLPGGRVGAVIGDVQGHDPHAAAVMGQLRIVLRAFAGEGHAPATVMARASEFLHELDTHRFATCTYAEVDLAGGALQIVRAGHIDPVLRHADGSTRWVPVPGGLPLGLSALFGRLDYPVTSVALPPGDTLLLCTDGLVELPGSDLDHGMGLLTQLVGEGPDDVAELADQLCEVVDKRRIDDDMALLLLRRTEESPVRRQGRLRQHVPPSDPEALSAARHMIRTAVRGWGAADRADEVELVADELITNALLHTEGRAVVTIRPLSPPGRRLRVEVEDRATTLPRRQQPDESGVSGRGLLLVDQLADVWGVESRGTGKCVWAEFS